MFEISQICHKTQFPSERMAKEAISAFHSKRRNMKNAKSKIPKRAYYCTTCRSWHVTSDSSRTLSIKKKEKWY